MTQLLQVPATPDILREYFSWYQARNLPAPPMAEHWIMISDRRGLICGTGLYPTKSIYLFGENLSTNPNAPLRLRHQAVSVLLKVLRSYCASTGKYPLVIIRHRSLIRMLTREGFRPQQAVVMSADPVALL